MCGRGKINLCHIYLVVVNKCVRLGTVQFLWVCGSVYKVINVSNPTTVEVRLGCFVVDLRF